jgi:hypothetical protein
MKNSWVSITWYVQYFNIIWHDLLWFDFIETGFLLGSSFSLISGFRVWILQYPDIINIDTEL